MVYVPKRIYSKQYTCTMNCENENETKQLHTYVFMNIPVFLYYTYLQNFY